jgi:hypothetical protein
MENVKVCFSCELYIVTEDKEEFFWKDFNDKTITIKDTGEHIYENDPRYNEYLLKAANRCHTFDNGFDIIGKMLMEIYKLRTKGV